MWAANILFALLFGLTHLPTASQMGIPLTAAVVMRTLIVNGAGGVLFGWLYWSFGLESAIVAHIAADVVVHGFVPLVTQQTDPTRAISAGAVVGLVTILTAVWSIRAIRRDRARFRSSVAPGDSKLEAGFSPPAG